MIAYDVQAKAAVFEHYTPEMKMPASPREGEVIAGKEEGGDARAQGRVNRGELSCLGTLPLGEKTGRRGSRGVRAEKASEGGSCR